MQKIINTNNLYVKHSLKHSEILINEISDYESKIMMRFSNNDLSAIELGRKLSILKKLNKQLTNELIHENMSQQNEGVKDDK